MIAFLALWLCVLSVAAIYYSIPPSGMRPDIYDPLDLVELRSRNVGYNYRGQPGLTTNDPSKVVGFSSFAAALLFLGQLKANFRTDWPGPTSSPATWNRPSRSACIQCPGRSVIDATPAAHVAIAARFSSAKLCL
jgi:hypothetical protein